ncbi:hypothetical protein BYT27DRAFT_7105392 [Phlegmacium glaucopus]|nr:hypothetical protein BYT27DRAFT_7105392 [Phlegmacium glaucopus]
MDEAHDMPQTNRFKHQSYKQSLKDVHLPSTFQQTHLGHEVGDNDSHFHEALDHWRQLNLAPSFIQFANKADSLSASMPLLLHNWKDIYNLWLEAFESADDEGFRALLDLLQKMAHDLRTTLSPIYSDILKKLLSLLPRSISPPALTCLLETFSSLFRYLLIPSLNLALLDQTWDAICQVLPKCHGEIQRAIAEVWGSCLRRMKKEAREKAVALLADRTGDIEDASAWALVFACKSVSQTLHTCAISIFTPLLEYHLSSSANTSTTYTLIRRTLTALVHHVKNAEQFALLGDLIVQKFSELLKSTDIKSELDVERLRKMIEVVGVVCSVRQGSRLTGSQMSLLFAQLDALPLTIPDLHRALLRYVTALFVAADMSMWLGPGLKFLQRTWRWNSAAAEDEPMSPQELAVLVTFTLKFNGCLASSNWGGWKLVALPLLYRSVLKADVDLKILLDFLARLKRVGKVGGNGVEKEKEKEGESVWKKAEEYAVARLTILKEKCGREMEDSWVSG